MYYLDAAQIDPEDELIYTRLPDELVNRSEVKSYLKQAREVIELKAIYQEVCINDKEDERVNLGGVWFASRVLRINLDNAARVFPYVITCGEDFERWYSAQGFISRYYLDAISGAIVSVAQEKMMNVIERKFGLSQTSRMSPGSLPDWPLEQQKLLFVLLGEEEVHKNVGVNLTENYVMLPTKSLSGIIFPTEHDFESCQLCKREDCPGRKADYDPQKARFYQDYEL